VIALVRIWCTDPGASFPRLLKRGCVAACPINPRIDTSAMIAGKIANTP
jgi:hypothetical protein